MPIIRFYHTPARGSGRERRVFFLWAEKREIVPIVVYGARERTVVQHMALKIVSSLGYSEFRCVPFFIKVALGGSV